MELEKVIPIGGERRAKNANDSTNAPLLGQEAQLGQATTAHQAQLDQQGLLLLLQALSEMSSKQVTSPELKAEQEDRRRKNTVDAVDMFFDTIMASDLCSPAVKALVGMLQLPVLKSAIANGMFFSDARHPARRLIKALYVQASKLEYSDKLQSNPDYIALENIVKKLGKEFDGDERLFLRAYFDICQLS